MTCRFRQVLTTGRIIPLAHGLLRVRTGAIPFPEVCLRLYFHLRGPRELIPDLEGIEVANLQEARTQAIVALGELRQEFASADRDWSGWTVTVADAAGAVLFSLDLDRDIR